MNNPIQNLLDFIGYAASFIINVTPDNYLFIELAAFLLLLFIACALCLFIACAIAKRKH